MGNLIQGVHHIALKCNRIETFEQAIRFYKEVLQMPVVRSWGEGIMLDTGNGVMEIFANAQDVLPQGTIRHFALATNNVDACVKAVREAGYPITTEPKDIVIASNPPYPARIAFCIGPVGEEIEFFQEREG